MKFDFVNILCIVVIVCFVIASFLSIENKNNCEEAGGVYHSAYGSSPLCLKKELVIE